MSVPICAVASAHGRSAVAVIRFSGNNCLSLVEKIFVPKFSSQKDLKKFPRKTLLGSIVFQKKIIDEVLLVPFLSPHSYTGEESGEIHCHGNPILIKQILQALFSSGFHMAKAGEFTLRAYQNGQMDLSQAQAIDDIIQARGERQLQHALYLMQGRFRDRLFAFRSQLLNLLADISAELDFADEDIEFISPAQLEKNLQELQEQLALLQKNSVQSERLRQGLEIAISGAPNSGKSSLLNYLVGSQRSLVSDIAGTTRDYIESEIEIAGVPIKFVDTAGIRDSQDQIEKAGILLSLQKAQTADLLLVLIDASQSLEQAMANSPLQKMQEKNIILVINKMDIAHASWKNFSGNWQDFSFKTFVQISLLKKTGLELLHKILEQEIEDVFPHQSGLMLSAWQLERLQKLQDELQNCQILNQHQRERELIASSLFLSVELLSELTGEIPNEEVLGRIFSRFCVGK